MEEVLRRELLLGLAGQQVLMLGRLLLELLELLLLELLELLLLELLLLRLELLLLRLELLLLLWELRSRRPWRRQWRLLQPSLRQLL